METVIGVIIFFAVIIGIGFLWQHLKRNVVFKGRYEQEKALVHHNRVYDTTASLAQVVTSLGRHIPTDDTVMGNIAGDKYQIKSQTADRIVYHHSSKWTVNGNDDEFTASITFSQNGTDLHGVLSIDNWRENAGVTRPPGLRAMQAFIDLVTAAFQAVDPNVRLSID